MGQSSRFVQFSVWIYLICSTLGNSSVDNVTYDGDTADGEMLVNLGKRIQKPLLTLIGMAIRNQHPCSEWTQWSSCTARPSRLFGTKKRTRKCSTYKTPGETALSKLEEDVSVCVGSCPSDYNLTANGYCLKLYRVGKPWDEAEKMCQNDGGHLVYIDNDAKFSDVKKFSEGDNSYIWINGRRKDINSPWETSYGEKLTKFYWAPGQPTNIPTELCLVLDPAPKLDWHDGDCTFPAFLHCEISV
jgi:hypothetical protein